TLWKSYLDEWGQILKEWEPALKAGLKPTPPEGFLKGHEVSGPFQDILSRAMDLSGHERRIRHHEERILAKFADGSSEGRRLKDRYRQGVVQPAVENAFQAFIQTL